MDNKMNDNLGHISPAGLFRRGFSYLCAAHYVSKANDDVYLHPRLFMYAQAIELGLKAYIMEVTGELRRGNDLQFLLSKAVREGLVVEESFPGIVKVFAALNEEGNTGDGLDSGAIISPNKDILFEEVTAFYKGVAGKITGAELTARSRKVA